MSDFAFLNRHRVRRGMFASGAEHGFNGAFFFAKPGDPRRIRVISSDGMGWQHVSVSFATSPKPPPWDVMCFVKSLFWKEDEWVLQFHPPQSEYVNNHPGCLHLWRCVDGREQPTPHSILVGIKELGELK